MLAKFRGWKYKHILLGVTFLIGAIFFAVDGGVSNWLIAIGLTLFSIGILLFKPSKQ